jgi:hypothetical protein
MRYQGIFYGFRPPPAYLVVEDQASHPPFPCEARHLEEEIDNALVF